MNHTRINKITAGRHSNYLARRLVLYVVLASTFIAIFTSAFQLYRTYSIGVSAIESRLNEVRDSYSANIASRVWIANKNQINITLRGILRLPDIEYIAVYENSELISESGKKSINNTIDRTFPLYFTFQKKRQKIGSVHITASLKSTYQHVIDQALDIIISNGIKTFLISGFMLFLFYQLVARHMITLGRFAETLDIDSLDNELNMNRTPQIGKIDEIDHLGNTLKSLQARLKESIHELKESQEQVGLLLDSTAEGIYGINTEGHCTFANQACLDILGYESDTELLGKNMHALIHHSHSDQSHYPVDECPINQAFIQNKDIHIDNEVLWRKDGNYFFAEYWSHPITKDSSCIGAVVTFLDITTRIESVNKLRANENNLAITLNSIGDAVIATDPQGNITRMNPVAEQLTGWNLKEAHGQSLKKIFRIINASTGEPIENPVDKVIATGETIYLSNHTTLTSKDGTEFQIADSAAPILDDGHTVGMVLVFNDVTEQYHLREIAAKSKRDLQAIMNHSPTAIYVKDLAGKYLLVNRSYEKLFHIDNHNFFGKTDHDFFPENIADNFQKNDQLVITTGHEIEVNETVPQEDGNHIYSSIKFPLFNENNEIYAVCSISTDISDRIQQEEQVRRSQKMDALGKLTGGIAHDYNNILGIVMGYAEQIDENRNNPDKISSYSKDIIHSVERGASLARKLLAFSQDQQHDIDVVNINRLLLDQELMLKKTLTARVELSFILEDQLWPVELDSGDFEDAIINISINALHAMDSGGQFTISTSNVTLSESDVQSLDLTVGDYVLLSFTDTGSGMDLASKERIFDPFYTTKGELGTGLGLSQVYGFIERSKGAIKVYSEIGHGSRFTLYFPRSLKNITTSPTVADDNLANFRGTETLLVVDDEEDMRKLAIDILSPQGYQVLTANDGEQALSILKNDKIDLMVSDVIMPNMDGYQLATKAGELYPQLKIQIVSGFSDERHTGVFETTLHKNMLQKPYHSNTLLARIRELLDSDTPEFKVVSKRTILVMDDDEAILELFAINLDMLGYNVITTNNGEETLDQYKKSLAETPVDLVIADLSIPGGMGGKKLAEKIHEINPLAKVIVSSGNTKGPEMTKPKDYGFSAALAKDFNRQNMKKVLEKVLADN